MYQNKNRLYTYAVFLTYLYIYARNKYHVTHIRNNENKGIDVVASRGF